ncbi:MAG: hypothetical protein LBI43_02630 [Streptococcaceae bacterium]|jgi:hypothetical protein|nr:hypothetical protein [Streptococcaceae bacterium]
MMTNEKMNAQFVELTDEELKVIRGGVSLWPWGGPVGWTIWEVANNWDSVVKGFNEGAKAGKSMEPWRP